MGKVAEEVRNGLGIAKDEVESLWGSIFEEDKDIGKLFGAEDLTDKKKVSMPCHGKMEAAKEVGTKPVTKTKSVVAEDNAVAIGEDLDQGEEDTTWGAMYDDRVPSFDCAEDDEEC